METIHMIGLFEGEYFELQIWFDLAEQCNCVRFAFLDVGMLISRETIHRIDVWGRTIWSSKMFLFEAEQCNCPVLIELNLVIPMMSSVMKTRDKIQSVNVSDKSSKSEKIDQVK